MLKDTQATDTFKETVCYFTTYQFIIDLVGLIKAMSSTVHVLFLCGQTNNYFQHAYSLSPKSFQHGGMFT